MIISSKEFKKAYKSVIKAVSSDENKGTLNGIHFVCANNTLTLETCDGYRAHSYSYIGVGDDCFDIVIPTFKLPAKLTEPITINCTNDTLIINWNTADNLVSKFKRINGEFFSFDKVAERFSKGSFEIGFNSTYLKEAFEGFDKDTKVKLTFNINKEKLSELYIEDIYNPENKRFVLPIRLV